MKNRKMDNRGLTLVELMVAVAISTLVIGAIWQFMLVSTRSYNSQKTITDLQQEVQQTMNQAENLIIDADRAVDYRVESTKKILEVFSANKIGMLVWDQDTNTLSYTETLMSNGVAVGAAETAILAEGVESFEADISKVETNKIVKISLGFAKNGKTYSATRNITLRNLIVSSGDKDEIYQGDVVQEVVPEITFNDPVTAVDPGKSYGYQATVTGSADTTLIWTVIKRSDNTVMDPTTGRLTVGMDEPEGTITIVATLQSNMEIVAMQEVTVNEAPPVAVDVTHFPETVIYGESYTLEATTNPVGYQITWEVVSGNATIEKTGSVNKLKVSMQQNGSQTVEVVAKVRIDSERVITTDTYVAKLRHPAFVVKTTDYQNKVNEQYYDRGSQVVLSADWSQSYANNSNYTESDHAFYGKQYVNYSNGAFTSEVIDWVYYLGNSTEAIEVEDSTITLPTSMNISQVKVVGTSSRYPFISAQKTLNLRNPEVSVTASIDGSDIGTGPIPFNKQVTLAVGVTGMDANSAVFSEWKAIDPDGKEVTLTVAGNKRTATFTLTDTLKYRGKTITVTVKEANTGKVGTIALTVAQYTQCNLPNTSTPTAELKYLFAERSGNSGSYPSQNAFFIPVDDFYNKEYKVTFYPTYGSTKSDWQEVMTFTKFSDGLLCKPSQKNYQTTNIDYNNISHIIVHVDDKNTGAHVALYKLVPVITTLNKSGVYYTLPYLPSELDELKNRYGTYQPYSSTEEYVNYYGRNVNSTEWSATGGTYPTAIKYTCEYTPSRVYNSGYTYDCYDIKITPQGYSSFTLKYYYSLRYYEWREKTW